MTEHPGRDRLLMEIFDEVGLPLRPGDLRNLHFGDVQISGRWAQLDPEPDTDILPARHQMENGKREETR